MYDLHLQMKIVEENQFRLVTHAGSLFFSVAAGLLGLAILTGPDWATNEIPESSITAMRWVGGVILAVAIWIANSKRVTFDADRQELVWRQRLMLIPFLSREVAAPFSSIDNIKVTHTGSGNNKGAMVHLVLADQRILRMSHLTIGRGTAKKLRERLLDWLNENKKH